jgi:vacuolar-type H+-ATPase subunit H
MQSDLLMLIDELEEVIASAPALPVGGRIVACRDELLDLIDAIRGQVPESVLDADRITHDKERILADAREESNRMIERARDQAAYLVQQHTVLKSAELEAERVLSRAREDAAQITSSAEYYAQELFTRLEEEALRLAAEIRKAAGRKP